MYGVEIYSPNWTVRVVILQVDNCYLFSSVGKFVFLLKILAFGHHFRFNNFVRNFTQCKWASNVFYVQNIYVQDLILLLYVSTR